MVRSNSRSHSSRSRSQSRSSSRSRSHSRSRSRKKRYSSRSRSRSYSRSRSRDRNYARDYRDYRGNRGMRRPYGYRGRGRGYYQGGPRYYRGGYRLNWQNRRQSRSPRRGRSRSRTPKRRSISQRSRSRSRQSHRSSSARSRGSSSSRSSSRHSRSPVASKRHKPLDKRGKKTEGTVSQDESGKIKQTEKSVTDVKCESDSTKMHSEFRKTPPVRSESWAGLSTYNDNSPRSHHSLSSLPSPTSLSPTRSVPSRHSLLQAVPPRLSSSQTSPPSSSLQHSPEQHSSSGHSASQYSPSQCSPLRKSPTKIVSVQHSVPREEVRLKLSAFSGDTVDQELLKAKYLKRYTEDEENRTFVLDRGDGREKDTQKERGLEKDKARGREWGDKGIDYGSSKSEYFRKEAEKMPYLTESPERHRQCVVDALSDELDHYRPKYQYSVTNQAEKEKGYGIESHWNFDSEESKYNTKIVVKGTKDHERYEDERSYKFHVASFSSSAAKEKLREEDKYAEKKYEERAAPKKEPASPEPVKDETFKELYDPSSSLPQQKNTDVRERDKMSFTEESPPRIKPLATTSCQPEVKLKMTSPHFEDSVRPGSSLTTERLLSCALVHSSKKEQGFRSIFDHLKLPQFYRSSSESFIQHIVALVHHVKEHYFKSTGMTLNERFTMYQKTTEDHGARQKSPEIHRRIDISPNSLRKHTRITEEDASSNEDNRKAEKKVRCDSVDLRHDIDQRRKEKSKEREGSRESTASKKVSLEKSGKEPKEYKDYKPFKEGSKYRNKDRDHSSCSSSSSPEPHEDREVRKERDDGSSGFKSFQGHTESAVFQGRGRPRGNFFRIRGGRGRARGTFSGSSTVSTSTANPNFQKRSKEEEWDPEYTPKSKKYFLHDDRDDGVDYWAKRGRGRGTFPRGRGRFIFKKSSSSPKWTHDKYQGSDEKEEEENGGIEDEEERKDRHKEEKVYFFGTSHLKLFPTAGIR
ncbi:bcl-2-associated transcription factor 1-like isoform X2 [Chiloscyllium plagiosum]|uniref:bcl-2-associated transcription factor 1-like isoform X2 n=1 Tax=Chiloscyllium plagiosum TaxID=36176 RepID=UPI001CB81004|nr:bcl-2-associated transcription factor 1-like isoform X2 [Chiloscyllium plagiosum]